MSSRVPGSGGTRLSRLRNWPCGLRPVIVRGHRLAEHIHYPDDLALQRPHTRGLGIVTGNESGDLQPYRVDVEVSVRILRHAMVASRGVLLCLRHGELSN